MKDWIDEIERLASASDARIVTCTRGADGVPNVAPEFLVHWDEAAVYFAKFPGSETIRNLEAFPEVAISLVDWVAREGIQLKGIGRPVELAPDLAVTRRQTLDWLASLGCRQIVRVEIHEIYDASPKNDLRKPVWSSGDNWLGGRDLPPFRKPAIEPAQMSPGLTQRLADTVARNLETRTPAYLGTIDGRGVPNLSPRFLLEAENSWLLYGDAFKNKSFLNQSRPCPVAVGLIDWEHKRGFQVRGWTDPQFRGEWILRVREHWANIGFRIDLVQAVLIRPEEVFELRLGPRQHLFTGNARTAWVPTRKAA